MKKRFPTYLLLLTAIAVCTSTEETTNAPVDFEENWVSKDYVENIGGNHSPKFVNDESIYYVT